MGNGQIAASRARRLRPRRSGGVHASERRLGTRRGDERSPGQRSAGHLAQSADGGLGVYCAREGAFETWNAEAETELTMTPNPPLGVVLHAIGGLMSAIFYLPYRRVKGWSWESYWLVGGVFSWIVAPWVIASLAVPNLTTILAQAPGRSVFWAYLCGVLW